VKINIIKDSLWKKNVSGIIANQINSVIKKRKRCIVFLTGGRSAASIYPLLREELFNINGNIDFFLGDERCVPSSHIESNYRMILKTLFPNGFPQGQVLHKMYNDDDSPEQAAFKYENLIPTMPDILLLGLGDDGHIASLFPGTNWQEDNLSKIITAISPINETRRITITKRVIDEAKEILVLASGSNKSDVVQKLYSKQYSFLDLPAILAKRGIWLIDESAASKINLNLI